MPYIKRAIALGFFDGVHVGHAGLLNIAKKRAQEMNLIPTVLSFDVHPLNEIKRKKVPLITSPADRADIIRRYFGINDIIFAHFDEKMMHMPWEEFIERLVKDFGAAHLVAGHDFSFGYKGRGNVDLLTEKCRLMGIGVDIVSEIRLEDVTISSTYIRKLLSEGDVERANKFLGHPHMFTDSVRYGYKFGRTIGVPTINMKFPEDVLIPEHGVYVTKVIFPEFGNEEHLAVTNIGVRPTVGGRDSVSVESHILDFDGDLYGKLVRIEFHKYLRREMKFSTPSKLKEQIEKDIMAVRKYFAK